MVAARFARGVRSSVAPLVVVLPALVWVWDASTRASWASLGRDQGIFQYVAWAARNGDLLYRDVRDVNGPVVAMVHGLFQALGGTDEHRFRTLDLVANALAFGVAGAALPSLSTNDIPVTRRVAWAVAAWVVLSAQYLAFGFWDTAQRESFFDWFVLLAIGAHAAWAPSRTKRAPYFLVASGLASFIPWFGKPTYALFSIAHVVALLVDRDAGATFKERLRPLLFFGLGGVLGLAVPFTFLALRGDVSSWARITFVDVPAMYRFIWPRPPGAILGMPGYDRLAALSFVTTVGLIALIVLGRLPRRALPIALVPTLGLVSVVVQAKGFPYHFHPVTLGISLAWLTVLVTTWERALVAARGIARLAVLVAAVLLGARAAYLASTAPFPPRPLVPGSDAHLDAYIRVDYFPRDLRAAAAYLKAHVAPSERIQVYGMDAYLNFLAERLSATPYIYAYDLNVDAALHGSFDEGGPQPNDDERARIQKMRDDHESDMLARLERSPPRAFVFIDRSPLMNSTDALEDFGAHCPRTAFWLMEHYREADDFTAPQGQIRIFLRQNE